MPDPFFQVVDGLVRQAEQAAATRPDLVHLVAEMIRLSGDRGADPYLLIGAVVEGAVHTLAKHIPAERQSDTAAAMVRLLLDRLNVAGLD